MESPVWSCEVCDQTVSRLLGMAGGVELPNGGVRVRPVVRGYCSSHKDDVREGFREELEAVGTILWFGTPDVELRPREAPAWLKYADLQLGSAVVSQAAASISGDGECPHCAAHVSWGTGPHIHEAASRMHAVAWECPKCGAGGVAYLEP